MGQRRLLAQKADRLASISYDWLLGVSLGFEKPYYLELIDDKDGDNLINLYARPQPERYSESMLQDFCPSRNLWRFSNWPGFNEIKPILDFMVRLGFTWIGLRMPHLLKRLMLV